MIPDKFLLDEQDPKAIDKVLGKLTDMLSSNEELLYIAVQKKPAVNLLPDCIAVTNKRIFYCEPGNLGITMNFKDISWKSIHEVSFKEELFGAKFTCTPIQGVPLVTDFIPKVQARKLYQVAFEQLELYKEQQLLLARETQGIKEPAKGPLFQDTEQFEEAVIVENAELPAAGNTTTEFHNEGQPEQSTPPVPNASQAQAFAPAAAAAPVEEPEDETTLKLRKLKSLYDKQLITLEEYEAKKASILDSF
jgi:hypothetical protein